MTSAALGAIIEVGIEKEINNRLRRLDALVKTKDQREIQVITGADVESLRLAEEAKAKEQKKTGTGPQ